MGTCEGRVGWLAPALYALAAIEQYTPQGAEMVSGMMYKPYEQG